MWNAQVSLRLDNIENIALSAGAGADLVTVSDLSGTDVTLLALDLAAPGGAGGQADGDRVVFNGSAVADTISVEASVASFDQTELGADLGGGTSSKIDKPVLQVRDSTPGRDKRLFILNSNAQRDSLTVNGLGGDDIAQPERGKRRAAYAGHICHASNKELAFDYLRDRAALGERASPLHLAVQALQGTAATPAPPGSVLRGLVFAIVDEANSVFIDEARTPLILSSQTGTALLLQRCEQALQQARAPQPGQDCALEPARRRIRLTEACRQGLAETCAANPATDVRHAEEDLRRALEAPWLYRLDEHYVVAEGKVQIVDAAAGRVMPDQSWEQGPHQMIECKEGVALTGERQTLARITYQRLFRRYLRLAGMSGTATEVAAEIGQDLGLPVHRVPLHRPSQRRWCGLRCLADGARNQMAGRGAGHTGARSVGGRREDPDIVSWGRSVELTWPSATARTNPSR